MQIPAQVASSLPPSSTSSPRHTEVLAQTSTVTTSHPKAPHITFWVVLHHFPKTDPCPKFLPALTPKEFYPPPLFCRTKWSGAAPHLHLQAAWPKVWLFLLMPP